MSTHLTKEEKQVIGMLYTLAFLILALALILKFDVSIVSFLEGLF